MEIKTDAIVLRATEYKDADKILTLFTPFNGKITAGIRGVKKSGAKLAFAAQPFAFCEYVLTQKNGRYTVVSAYLYDGFFPLRTDIVRFYAACAVCEICDALCMEGDENENLFVAAAQALRSLSYAKESCGESLCAFLLTALFEAGYMIDLDGCGVCGNGEIGADTRCFFDFTSGRFLCANCAESISQGGGDDAGTSHGNFAGNASGGKPFAGNLAAGAVRASGQTYLFLRECFGLSDEETLSEEKKADGEARALRLLKTYLTRKTEREYPCFAEFLRLYGV